MAGSKGHVGYNGHKKGRRKLGSKKRKKHNKRFKHAKKKRP